MPDVPTPAAPRTDGASGRVGPGLCRVAGAADHAGTRLRTPALGLGHRGPVARRARVIITFGAIIIQTASVHVSEGKCYEQSV